MQGLGFPSSSPHGAEPTAETLPRSSLGRTGLGLEGAELSTTCGDGRIRTSEGVLSP
jgi:hypothetical protein